MIEAKGPCAKTTVVCTLITKDGEYIIGTNECRNPQKSCPREVGEGYDKCKTICDQVGHAEEVAVCLAGPKAEGSKAYVEGHTHVCSNCQSVLRQSGVVSFTVGPPHERA